MSLTAAGGTFDTQGFASTVSECNTSVAASQPYLRRSVLRNLGAGLVAQISKSSSAYATVSYLTNLGGSHQRTITGNAGLRWSW
jgi:outer membrane autotransporter protein